MEVFVVTKTHFEIQEIKSSSLLVYNKKGDLKIAIPAAR
jgi:hypothetical protein